MLFPERFRWKTTPAEDKQPTNITKTQVLIEKKDELFGTNYKEWKDQFIWGLDLTGAITGFIVISGSLLLWIFRRKT